MWNIRIWSLLTLIWERGTLGFKINLYFDSLAIFEQTYRLDLDSLDIFFPFCLIKIEYVNTLILNNFFLIISLIRYDLKFQIYAAI